MTDIDVAPKSADANERHFQTHHLMDDLRGRSIRGGTVTLAAQAVKFALNLGSTMVLARLLTPADYGLVAMVTAVTGFVGIFKDLGLSMATVQRAEITHEQVSTLFWLNVVLSVALMAITATLAPAIAWLYHEPRLVWITLALAATFLFGGLTAQHQALLTRQMRFGTLAYIEIGTLLIGTATGVALAWRGASYWALVGMAVATALANCSLVWILSGWRPGLPVRGSGLWSMVVFGGNLTGFNVVNYFARNADKLLLGWWWGPVPVGLYAKAYQLLMLPISQLNGPVSAVMVPGLSRLQDQPNRYRRYYFGALRLLATVGMPLVALCFVMTEEIITLALGPGWDAAIPIFRVMAPAAFVGTMNVAAGWVYVSLGQTDRMFKWSFIGVPLVVIAFVVGLPFGVLGVAVGCSVGISIGWMLGMIYCFHGTFLDIMDLCRAVWLPAASAMVAAAGAMTLALVAARILPGHHAALVKLSTFGTLLALTWAILPGGRAWLRTCTHLASTIRGDYDDVRAPSEGDTAV